MISIIVCSRHTSPDESFVKNINDTIGVPYELVHIDNSANEYSIFSAYNKGIELSRFPFLCFVHDDVEFMTPNWGEKLLDHLQHLPNVGLVGVAGGKAVLKVPYDWSSYYPMCNIIHSGFDKDNKLVDVPKRIPKDQLEKSDTCVVLDGVFLAAQREIFKRIRFDESVGGFHCYDLDICIQATNAGYQNSVIFDVDLRHYSRGCFNEKYIEAILCFYKKWYNLLPIIDSSLRTEFTENKLLKAEKRTLERLRKRLVRTGMSFSEIISMEMEYRIVLGQKNLLFYKPISYIRLYSLLLTSTWRKKMIWQKEKLK